jgi:hypothetical protein
MANRTTYDNLFKDLQNKIGNRTGFKDQLDAAVNEKTQGNKDLYDKRAAIESDLRAMPNEMRNEFSTGNIRNPLNQEALISRRQGTLQSSLGSTLDQLKERKTFFGDILDKVLGGYDNDAKMLEMSTNKAREDYMTDLQQENLAKQMAQQERLAKLARGGGGPTASLDELLKSVQGGNNSTNNTKFSTGWKRLQASRDPNERMQIATGLLDLIGSTGSVDNSALISKLQEIAVSPGKSTVTGKAFGNNSVSNLLAKLF